MYMYPFTRIFFMCLDV